MHLLIAFAHCGSDGCSTALRSLRLPHLEKLLSRLTPGPVNLGDEHSLSTPQERVLAQAQGLPLRDGLIPWAALQARSVDAAWGFVTPCHWRMGSQHVAMSGSTLPDFSADESQALLAAMQPYFAEDGIALQYQQPERWLAHGAPLADLATASLERVVGRDIAHWLPHGPQATRLQRLQAEMQMLLYTHPVNDARSARGVPPVNAFWLSGTGALAQLPEEPPPGSLPIEENSLRQAALQEDWSAWAQAWQALDAGVCAALLTTLNGGRSVQLTLCGERNAQTFQGTRSGLAQRVQSLFNPRSVVSVLEQL